LQHAHGAVKIRLSAGSLFQFFDKRNKLYGIINREQFAVQLHQLCHVPRHNPVFFTAILSPLQNLLLDFRLVSQLAGCSANYIVNAAKFFCYAAQLRKRESNSDDAKSLSRKAFHLTNGAFRLVDGAFINFEQNLVYKLSDDRLSCRWHLLTPSLFLAPTVLNVALHHNQVIQLQHLIQIVNIGQLIHGCDPFTN